MASDSGQKFISRNRKPRVHITYEDPYDANRLVEIPFVMGVLADLTGSDIKGSVEVAPKSDMNERGFLDIDMDNFEQRMKAIQPTLAFHVPNKLSGTAGEQIGVHLTFSKMEDFGPVQVARQVPELARLLEARTQLANLQRYMDGKTPASDILKRLLESEVLMKALSSRAAPATIEDQPEAGAEEQEK